jgi:predicted DNA-binding protein (UPF0251 family)
MPRKRCCGRIDEYPVCLKFVSHQGGNHTTVSLGIEEVEAIRLKDMKGYDQQACAKEMGLTRPTFQRVLASARKKVATALVEGRTILIEGGNYIMKNRVFECLDCGETWKAEPCSANGERGYEIPCPKCGSMNKAKIDDGEKHVCGGQAHQHGVGHRCCGGHH